MVLNNRPKIYSYTENELNQLPLSVICLEETVCIQIQNILMLKQKKLL